MQNEFAIVCVDGHADVHCECWPQPEHLRIWVSLRHPNDHIAHLDCCDVIKTSVHWSKVSGKGLVRRNIYQLTNGPNTLDTVRALPIQRPPCTWACRVVACGALLMAAQAYEHLNGADVVAHDRCRSAALVSAAAALLD